VEEVLGLCTRNSVFPICSSTRSLTHADLSICSLSLQLLILSTGAKVLEGLWDVGVSCMKGQRVECSCGGTHAAHLPT
jgi:hypothetical protein